MLQPPKPLRVSLRGLFFTGLETSRDNGHQRAFARLLQRENLEQLVHRAEAAREYRERIGAHSEVHLTDAKIVKAEHKVWRREAIRLLLVRQHDVEPNARRTSIGCAAIGGLHDARSAAVAMTF